MVGSRGGRALESDQGKVRHEAKLDGEYLIGTGDAVGRDRASPYGPVMQTERLSSAQKSVLAALEVRPPRRFLQLPTPTKTH